MGPNFDSTRFAPHQFIQAIPLLAVDHSIEVRTSMLPSKHYTRPQRLTLPWYLLLTPSAS